jgi:hypothetical protein
MSSFNAAICTTISYTWVELCLPFERRETYCFSLIFFFRFFSAKLVWTITFLSFEIGQWYFIFGYMTRPGQENTIKKTIIWPWDQRSRSHKGHYGMRHTALWSCIYELSVHELVRICMTIRRYVMYRNDLCGTLTFDLKVK